MDFSIKLIALYSPVFVSLVWGITLYLKNCRSKKPGYYMSFVQFSTFAVFASIVPFYHNRPLLSARFDALFYAGLLSVFPFVFFYIRHIATKERLRFGSIWPHLLPAMVFAGIGLMIPLSLSAHEMNIYALNWPVDRTLHKQVYFFQLAEPASELLLTGQSVLYLYLISVLIQEYKSRVRNYFSNVKSRYFDWIHIFYAVFIVALSAAVPALITGNSYLIKSNNQLLTISFFVLSGVFYLIAYIADNHQYISDDNFYVIDDTEADDRNTGGVQKKLAYKLKNHFKHDKPYLNKDLKISDVAGALASNRTYVSDTIRNVYKSNFIRFVNSYRINEAVAFFADETYRHLTTVEISERAGFNTYGSFAKAFKKRYNCTPNSYRKKMEKTTMSLPGSVKM